MTAVLNAVRGEITVAATMPASRMPDNFMEKLLTSALETLKRPGAVLLLPTETVYGLVCDWEDHAAREKIYQLKGRAENKPLAMFSYSAQVAAAFGVQFNEDAQLLISNFTPGPITVIAPALGVHPTVGVRIPDHPFVLELLKHYQRPLASTSANASGMPNVLTVQEAVAQLHGSVDLVIDGGTLPADAAASTVVSVCEKPCRVLRQGPISEDAIKKLLHQ